MPVMDYATLTDNQGRKADFRNVILIMTSNAGASRIGKGGIGFASASENGIGFAAENADSDVIMEAVNNTFQPEFRNRLNRMTGKAGIIKPYPLIIYMVKTGTALINISYHYSVVPPHNNGACMKTLILLKKYRKILCIPNRMCGP